MAKTKDWRDEPEEATFPEPSPEVPPEVPLPKDPANTPDDPRFLLWLAEQDAAKAAEPDDGGHPHWLVELQYAAPWVVAARDPANAWEAYRAATGLTTTQYQPSISATDAPLGRVTV